MNVSSSARLFGSGGILPMAHRMPYGFRAWMTAAVVIVIWGMTFANTRALQGDFSALDVLVAWYGLVWAAQRVVKEMIYYYTE